MFLLKAYTLSVSNRKCFSNTVLLRIFTSFGFDTPCQGHDHTQVHVWYSIMFLAIRCRWPPMKGWTCATCISNSSWRKKVPLPPHTEIDHLYFPSQSKQESSRTILHMWNSRKPLVDTAFNSHSTSRTPKCQDQNKFHLFICSWSTAMLTSLLVFYKGLLLMFAQS